MDAESARPLLVDYIDGKLDPDTVAEIDRCLETNPALKRELSQLRDLARLISNADALKSDETMRVRFDALLRTERANYGARGAANRAFQLAAFPPALRMAAALAVAATGVALGWQWHSRRDAPALPAIADTAEPWVGSAFFQFASDRLQWIGDAERAGTPEPELIVALFEIVADDPNGAVRLTALEALGRFNEVPDVRRQLIERLPAERDPIMQMALIRILAETGSQDGRASIEQLLHRLDVRGVVKGQAQRELTYY